MRLLLGAGLLRLQLYAAAAAGVRARRSRRWQEVQLLKAANVLSPYATAAASHIVVAGGAAIRVEELPSPVGAVAAALALAAAATAKCSVVVALREHHCMVK